VWILGNPTVGRSHSELSGIRDRLTTTYGICFTRLTCVVVPLLCVDGMVLKLNSCLTFAPIGSKFGLPLLDSNAAISVWFQKVGQDVNSD
jgi:hypothetical protein